MLEPGYQLSLSSSGRTQWVVRNSCDEVLNLSTPRFRLMATGADELTLARPGLRVLYMTGYAGAALNQAQGELLSPEDGVIQKPFTSDALLDRVRAALLSPATAEED